MKALLTAMVFLGGCMSPVVGGECRPGLTACDGRCVDLSLDPQNCGACGSACPSEQACVYGACSHASLDDGAIADPDAGVAAADSGASIPRAPRLARTTIDFRSTTPHPNQIETREFVRGCGLGELACSDACVHPDRDPSHCGGCGRACAPGDVCVEGSCAAACDAPFQACGSACVDTTRDPDHCGGCDVACDTGVCVDGTCESSLAGHLVVIGHDYAAQRTAMARIVGNAVLLASGRVVDVLAYEGTTSAESREGVIAAIDATARDAGRTCVHESAPADRVSYRLADADVFVIHAQQALSLEEARSLGAQWQVAIRSFLERGGTIVALVGPSNEAGTLTILESAGLLAPTETQPSEITGAFVRVVRSSDAVAVGVQLTYRAERSTVRLPLGLDHAVVADGVGPVVVHQAITHVVD